MSSFSECDFSKCIITGNEEFIQRKHSNGITKFDAVAINIESYKENVVGILNHNIYSTLYKFVVLLNTRKFKYAFDTKAITK